MLVIAQKLNKYSKFYETSNNMTIFQMHDADQYSGQMNQVHILIIHLQHTIKFYTLSKATFRFSH
jgi:hypothetical protein